MLCFNKYIVLYHIKYYVDKKNNVLGINAVNIFYRGKFANDEIAIESNSHTNGLIPEGDGTAWARGRWSELSIKPSNNTNTNIGNDQ